MITDLSTLRIRVFRLVQAIDTRWSRLLWTWTVGLPSVLLRILTLGRIRLLAPTFDVLLSHTEARLAGVRKSKPKELEANASNLRSQARAILERVEVCLCCDHEDFDARISALAATIDKSAAGDLDRRGGDPETAEHEILDGLLRDHAKEIATLATEWFARERSIELREEQVMGALGLIDGDFVEMQNGEGKTFTIAVAAAAIGLIVERWRAVCARHNFTSRRNVVVLTANEYLVRRDYAWIKDLWERLEISHGYVLDHEEMEWAEKRAMHAASVVYSTGSIFGFDVLRDSLRDVDVGELDLHPFRCIVDEADQLLLDEAKTPHILVGETKVDIRSIIPQSWVEQVSSWLHRYFVPNKVYEEPEGAPGRVGLTPAGKLLLQRPIREAEVPWPVAIASPFWSEVHFSLVYGAAAAYQLGLDRPGWPTVAQIESLIGDTIPDTQDLVRHLRERRVSGRRAAFGDVLDLMKRLVGLDKAAAVYLTPDEREEYRLLKRETLKMIVGLARRQDDDSDSVAHLVLESTGRLERETAERFWLGIWYLHATITGKRPPVDPPAPSLTRWIHECAAPFTLATMDSLEKLRSREGRAGVNSMTVRVMIKIFRVIQIVQNTLNRAPNAQELIEKAGLAETRMLAMFAANRLLGERGTMTGLGREVAEILVEMACREEGIASGLGRAEVFGFVRTAIHVFFDLSKRRDYVVEGQEIVLVSQITGRRQPHRTFGQNRHPFVLLKENLPYRHPMPITRTMPVATFLQVSDHIVGLSGTLADADEELRWTYRDRLQRRAPAVVRVPPFRERRLEMRPNLVFKTIQEKHEGLAREILAEHKLGRPVLVLTNSVEESEAVHKVVNSAARNAGIRRPIPLLNAVYHEREEEIISHAGEAGVITIATQMAGRGTDITLSAQAENAGGLHVAIVGVPENARVLQQAQGRAARQGDPGSTRLFLSLDDPFFYRFENFPRVRAFLESMLSQGEAIEHSMLDEAIENAQKGLEVAAWRARRENVGIDLIQMPTRWEALGWREDLVRPQAAGWRRALASIFHLFEESLGNSAPNPWQRKVRQLLDALDLTETDEEAASQLTSLFSLKLSESDVRVILAALRAAERRLIREITSDHPDYIMRRARAISSELWTRLKRLDLQRYERVRDRLYEETPRTYDPAMPDLTEYLRAVERELVRGIDPHQVHREFHSKNKPTYAQILGPKELIEQAVVYGIEIAEPEGETITHGQGEIGVPGWLRPAGEGSGRKAAADEWVSWLESLSPGQRYRVRTDLVRTIDALWSELLDEQEVLVSVLERDPTVTLKNYDLKRAERLTGILLKWRQKCALAVVEACDRVRKKVEQESAKVAVVTERLAAVGESERPFWTAGADALTAAFAQRRPGEMANHDA